MARSSFQRIILAATLTAAALLALPTGTALGVTPPTLTQGDAKESSLTTGAASRARADVQIRRIKTLMVTRQTGRDAAYQELERLQKELRGQK